MPHQAEDAADTAPAEELFQRVLLARERPHIFEVGFEAVGPPFTIMDPALTPQVEAVLVGISCAAQHQSP